MSNVHQVFLRGWQVQAVMEDEVAEVRAIHPAPDPLEVHLSPAQIWGTSVYIIVIPTLRFQDQSLFISKAVRKKAAFE